MMPENFVVNRRVRPDVDFLAAIQMYAATFDRVAKLRSYAASGDDVAEALTAAERALAAITSAIYGPDEMLRMAGALETESEQRFAWGDR